MSDELAIAETLAVDFTAAMKAAQKARNAAVDGIEEAVRDANSARMSGLAEVRRMRDDAAQIEEKTESDYRAAMTRCLDSLAGLRSGKKFKVTCLSGCHTQVLDVDAR